MLILGWWEDVLSKFVQRTVAKSPTGNRIRKMEDENKYKFENKRKTGIVKKFVGAVRAIECYNNRGKRYTSM